MQLVLHHCWKEWRAQRAVLTAYSLLAFVSLCLVFLLVPEPWWHEDGRCAMELGCFVAIGAVGVVTFVAPALVRAEFSSSGGQFVGRLPGALAASFAGKLLFLVLVTLALPLLGLVLGELFLQAIGQPWHDLFTYWQSGEVTIVWPWTAFLCGYALLLAPWVWAIGTWLPGGRMAFGGMVLFFLLLGVGVFAVLRLCPELEKDIAWQPWLWLVAPLGLVTAGISWVKGRRGGGALRSARFGVAAVAIGLVSPAAWFGNEVWLYHYPDPQQLAQLRVTGMTQDQRYVLAYGAAQRAGHGVPLRIDLATGRAEQLGGIHQWFTSGVDPNFQRPGRVQRYWGSVSVGANAHGSEHSVFDLATGAWTPVGYDEKARRTILPPELQAKVVEDVRATTPLRAPGNRKVWLLDDELCVEEPDGSVSRRPWQPRSNSRFLRMRPAGHGLALYSDLESFFDLCLAEIEPSKKGRWSTAVCVRDRWIYKPRTKSPGGWHQLEPNGDAAPCEPLRGAIVLGLFDDDTLLCAVLAPKGVGARLFLYQPARQRVEELTIPKDLPFKWVGTQEPMATWQSSMLARDPGDRIWLCCQSPKKQAFACIDTATRRVTVCPWIQPGATWFKLLGWPDADSVLVQQDTEVLRIHLATGSRTVLFPRQ